jgi:hypothetical protein
MILLGYDVAHDDRPDWLEKLAADVQRDAGLFSTTDLHVIAPLLAGGAAQ